MSSVLVRGLGRSALLLALVGLPACGGSKKPTTMSTAPRDAGDAMQVDADVPLPREDAGMKMKAPGMPEPGLTGTCAIDSNKIFTLVERDEPFAGTPLAVDPINSLFALPFVAKDGKCLDAVHMASLVGDAASGAPKSSLAIDECANCRINKSIYYKSNRSK
jgi:hypothetical protein